MLRRSAFGVVGTILALLLAALLPGCARSPVGGAQPDGRAGAGFPVSVTGKFGAATVPVKPIRVVAMSWTDADYALALGMTPVGIAKANDIPQGLQPWTASALGQAKPKLFNTLGGDPLEEIAALRPDLILGTKDYNLARSYQQLTQIAPVVTYVNGPNTDAWQQDFAQVATALGETAKGKQVVTDIETRLAAQKATYPQLNGRTFSYIIQPTPSGAYTVNAGGDVSAQVLSTFGMRLTPTVLGLPNSEIPNRARLSSENFGLLDADVVIVSGSPSELASLATNPVFTRLGAVRRGAYLLLDYTAGPGMAFPSPLSLNWAIEQVVPKLAQAAQNSLKP